MGSRCPRCGDEIGEYPTVLVAVLDKAFGRRLSEIFSGMGMTVVCAEGSREIFSLLESARPGIALLDVRFPPLLGLDLPEIIRRSPRFRDVRIVPVSSHEEPYPPEEPEGISASSATPEGLSGGSRMEGAEGKKGGGLSAKEEALHLEARRLARIIVSDIVLYNPEKVEEGVFHGTFYNLLKEEIEEGRLFYEERTPASVTSVRDHYDEALAEYLEKKRKSAFTRSS